MNIEQKTVPFFNAARRTAPALGIFYLCYLRSFCYVASPEENLLIDTLRCKILAKNALAYQFSEVFAKISKSISLSFRQILQPFFPNFS